MIAVLGKSFEVNRFGGYVPKQGGDEFLQNRRIDTVFQSEVNAFPFYSNVSCFVI